MKKILLIAVMAIFTTGAFAASTTVFKPSQNKSFFSYDTATYKLDLGDITKLDRKEIGSKVDSFIKTKLKNIEDDELTCSVEVTGTLNFFGQSLSIKVTVSGPCSEIEKAGGAIAKKILAAVQAALPH